MRNTINFSLPREIIDRLDAAAAKTGLKKSTIAAQALDKRLREIEAAK